MTNYRNNNLIPGDEISITVYRHDELNRKIIIPPDGYIFYPLVGEINTNGKSIRELREFISAGLTRYFNNIQVEVNYFNISRPKLVVDPQVAVEIVKLAGYKSIHNPQVGIEITAYAGRKIFILGEVRSPGVYLSDGSQKVLDVITMAGGFTLDARSGTVLLIRAGNGKIKNDVKLINIEKLLLQGDSSDNLLIHKGDTIYVPRTYIADVNRFFTHLSAIISPLINLETGYFIGQQISASNSSSSVGVR